MTKFDWSKPFRRKRDKVRGRLIAQLDAPTPGFESHVVAFPSCSHEGREILTSYHSNGKCFGDEPDDDDLENVPEPPKMRPYRNHELRKLMGQWLRKKTGTQENLVTGYSEPEKSGDAKICIDGIWRNAKGLLMAWEHVNGEPCGVIDEPGSEDEE